MPPHLVLAQVPPVHKWALLVRLFQQKSGYSAEHLLEELQLEPFGLSC